MHFQTVHLSINFFSRYFLWGFVLNEDYYHWRKLTELEVLQQFPKIWDIKMKQNNNKWLASDVKIPNELYLITLSLSRRVSKILFNFLDRGLLCCIESVSAILEDVAIRTQGTQLQCLAHFSSVLNQSSSGSE